MSSAFSVLSPVFSLACGALCAAVFCAALTKNASKMSNVHIISYLSQRGVDSNLVSNRCKLCGEEPLGDLGDLGIHLEQCR